MNELTNTTEPQIAYSECYAQVFLGDCLELYKNIEPKSIDLILTDLPYGTTKLIGRTRRHESLTYCQVELLFDAENEFDLETNEKIFNSETQNKGTQRSPFGMWS